MEPAVCDLPIPGDPRMLHPAHGQPMFFQCWWHRGCDWVIALQRTSEIVGGQKCKRKPNTLAKMFCEVVIWQNTEVVLGLGLSRQSSSFPQLQPCDPCAPCPAGWSGAAPAGEVENAPLRRALVCRMCGGLAGDLSAWGGCHTSIWWISDCEILVPPPSLTVI